MIDEKKLIEDLINNDGMNFVVKLHDFTPEGVAYFLREYTDKLKEGFIDLINAQKKQEGWISTKEIERLPKCFESVIINVPSCSPLPTVFEAYRNYDDIWLTLHGEAFSFYEVPFWMPMPEPPNEGEL